MSRKLRRQAMKRRKKHHRDFHLTMKLSTPSQEAEKFAKEVQRVVKNIRRKHFPDTLIYDYKLGHLM